MIFSRSSFVISPVAAEVCCCGAGAIVGRAVHVARQLVLCAFAQAGVFVSPEKDGGGRGQCGIAMLRQDFNATLE